MPRARPFRPAAPTSAASVVRRPGWLRPRRGSSAPGAARAGWAAASAAAKQQWRTACRAPEDILFAPLQGVGKLAQREARHVQQVADQQDLQAAQELLAEDPVGPKEIVPLALGHDGEREAGDEHEGRRDQVIEEIEGAVGEGFAQPGQQESVDHVRLDHEQHGPAAELVDKGKSLFIFAHGSLLVQAEQYYQRNNIKLKIMGFSIS